MLASGKVRCSPCSRRSSALCVAAGGCGWLRSSQSPPLRAVAGAAPGRDGKAGSFNRTGKLRVADPTQPPSPAATVMHFYSGPPLHLLSGVDIGNIAGRITMLEVVRERCGHY